MSESLKPQLLKAKRDEMLGRVRANGACLEWTGPHFNDGIKRPKYPRVHFDGKYRIGSRLMFMLTHGSIPDGLLVCHTCDNSMCINPEHLYAGTHAQNAKDAVDRKRHRSSRKTHCKRGHSLATARITRVGERKCRECDRLRCVARRAKAKALSARHAVLDGAK